MDCPDWCTGPEDHAQAVRDGEPNADTHMSCLYGAELLNVSLAGTVDGRMITGQSWKAVMLEPPTTEGVRDLPTIVLEVSSEAREGNGTTERALMSLHLTPSEAETMAGYLMALVNAEKADGGEASKAG